MSESIVNEFTIVTGDITRQHCTRFSNGQTAKVIDGPAVNYNWYLTFCKGKESNVKAI